MAMQQDDFIKKPHLIEKFTNHQAIELLKCAKDPIYFCENYVKVQHPTKGAIPFKMFDYQHEIIDVMHNNNKSVVMAGRQLGKCLNERTLINIKSPKGVLIEISIGDFYNWLKFREWVKDENIEQYLKKDNE